MDKQVAVLAEKTYEDLELWYPKLRLQEAGFAVSVIGPDKSSTYVGKYGYPVKPDIGISEAVASQFAAVVIPGGFAPDYMRRVPAMVKFVRDVWSNGGIVAAICHGAWMAASADIIRGKHITSFFAIKDDIVNAGGLWEDSEVVADGNLITSRKPEDLPAFLNAILSKLQ